MNKKVISQRKVKSPLSPKTEVWIGSGNVYADIGLPNPEKHMAKAELVIQINQLVKAAGLTSKQAASKLRIDSAKVSAMFKGHFADFSIDRLLSFINALNHDVIISIRPARVSTQARVQVRAG